MALDRSHESADRSDDGAVDLSVPVRGGDLHLRAWGLPADTRAMSGPVVLAVHGLTMSHKTWAPVATRCPGIPFVALDLRGRGASSTLPGAYGLDQHAADVEAVVTALGLTEIVLVGHAMGGYVCERVAIRRPETVAEIVLVDGGLNPSPPDGIDVDEFVARFLGPALARLSERYPSQAAYRTYWQEHPAFKGPGVWNDNVAAFVDYDLVGSAPELTSRTVEAAVREDFVDGRLSEQTRQVAFSLQATPIRLLRAEGGLLDQRPGLIDDALLAEYQQRLPQMTERFLPNTNHYTITLAEPGLSVVVEEITAAVDRVRRSTRNA